jgi:hypothetical protein
MDTDVNNHHIHFGLPNTIGASTCFASYFSHLFSLSYNRRALNTIAMSMLVPLWSQSRDARLQGAANGISYNQKESAQAAATGSIDSSAADYDSIKDSDLETLQDIDFDKEPIDTGNHNANSDTHNTVSQQNGRATVTTTAAARTHCPNENANQPPALNIIKIDAALRIKTKLR